MMDKFLMIFPVLTLMTLAARAEDPVPPILPILNDTQAPPALESATPPAPLESAPDPAAPAPALVPSAKKARRPSDKEAEGTQAPNRFEGDPVIRSRYELNGQPLEVDPD